VATDSNRRTSTITGHGRRSEKLARRGTGFSFGRGTGDRMRNRVTKVVAVTLLVFFACRVSQSPAEKIFGTVWRENYVPSEAATGE